MFLPILFIILGIGLIGLGIWILAKMYGRHSVEVDAECVDISSKTVYWGIWPHRHHLNTKVPTYHYWYSGKEYIGQSTLRSGRSGYRPKLGPCKIRINTEHPERIYSTERKAAAAILILVGSIYLIVVVVANFLIWGITASI